MKPKTMCCRFALLTAAMAASLISAAPAAGQTVTIVGTQHLEGLDPTPDAEQLEHAVEAMAAFEPTQVCIERMGGGRLQALSRDPQRHGMALDPATHGRPLGTLVIPLGKTLQTLLEIRPADARESAAGLAARWDELSLEDRIELIGLQVAGYEFYSAALNWSYLTPSERIEAEDGTLGPAAEALTATLTSADEVYSLAVPLARRAGLHELCTADSQEYEADGMRAALEHGGITVMESPAVSERLAAYSAHMNTVWRPESGPDALTHMLGYMNSEAFVAFDMENQWRPLREHDNDDGAFARRLMYWHARTAQISSELYRALAQGRDERVLFIVGAAHRPFNEAEMRAQPWLRVEPASSLFQD